MCFRGDCSAWIVRGNDAWGAAWWEQTRSWKERGGAGRALFGCLSCMCARCARRGTLRRCANVRWCTLGTVSTCRPPTIAFVGTVITTTTSEDRCVPLDCALLSLCVCHTHIARLPRPNTDPPSDDYRVSFLVFRFSLSPLYFLLRLFLARKPAFSLTCHAMHV